MKKRYLKKVFAIGLLCSVLGSIPVSLIGFQLTGSDRYLLNRSGLSYVQQQIFETTLTTFERASRYQQITAAKQVLSILKTLLQEKSSALAKASNQEDADQEIIQLKASIIAHQCEHLKEFIRIESSYLTLSDTLRGILNRWWQLIVGTEPITNLLAEQLAQYFALERTVCFQTYTSTMNYFVFHASHSVPPIIALWSEKSVQFALAQRIKNLITTPIIQAEVGVIGAKIGATAGKTLTRTTSQVGTKTAGLTAEKLATEFPIIAKQAGTKVADDFLDGIAGLFKPNESRVLSSTTDEIVGTQSSQTGRNMITQAADGTTTALSEQTLQALKAVDEVAAQLTKGIAEKLAGAAQQGEKALAKATKEILKSAQQFAKEGFSSNTILQQGSTPAQKLEIATNVVVSRAARLTAYRQAILSAQEQIIREGSVKGGKKLTKEALSTIKKFKVKYTKVANNQNNALIRNLRTITPEIEAQLSNQGGGKAVKTLLTYLQEMHVNLATPGMNKWVILTQISADMMFQMGVMQGIQKAQAWIEDEKLRKFAQLQAKQKMLSSELEARLNGVQLEADTQRKLLALQNQKRMEDLAAQQQAIITKFAQQQTYVMQTLITSSIAENYLSDPMGWDQYFLYAPMLTPNMTVKNPPLPPSLLLPTYKAPAQVFYQGPWAQSPIVVIKKVTETPIWLFRDGKVVPYYKPTQTTQLQAAPAVDMTRLAPILDKLPKDPVAHTWYNVARKGNWGYDVAANQFCQYRISTIEGSGQAAGQTAGDNSIFVDYIPVCVTDLQGMPLYMIQIEVTVTGAKPPWLAGIMFNKARWISGVTDNMDQYRFCGLYGGPGNGTTPVLCAGETFFVKNKDNQTKLDPINPLAQIMATANDLKQWAGTESSKIPNPLYPRNDGTSNNQSPLTLNQTYRITVITQPEQIILLMEQKKDGAYSVLFGPSIITNRNPILFNYHGIGLVSAGCSTQFSILKPEQLTYTQAHRDAFTKLVSSGAK